MSSDPPPSLCAPQSFAERLKSFRPSATVFEAQIAPGRRGEGAGAHGLTGVRASHAPGDFVEVMRRKREQHEPKVAQAKKEKEHRTAAAAAEVSLMRSGGVRAALTTPR